MASMLKFWLVLFLFAGLFPDPRVISPRTDWKPPTKQEQDNLKIAKERLTKNKGFFPKDGAVDDALKSLDETVKIEWNCDKVEGAITKKCVIEIKTVLKSWNKNVGEKAGFYEWGGVKGDESVTDKEKKIVFENVLAIDPDEFATNEKSVYGQCVNVALLYHELLHAQLLINAMKNDKEWREKYCKCDFDFAPADLDDPHKTIPGLQKAFMDSLWDKVSAKPKGKEWVSYRPIIPKDAVVVMTGTVVSGKPFTISCFTPEGAAISGRVVSVGEQKQTTDDYGRASFVAPTGSQIITATLADAADFATAYVLPETSSAPRITSCPQYLQVGRKTRIHGEGLCVSPDDTRVFVGSTECFLLASSPSEAIFIAPRSIPLGNTEFTVQVGEQKTKPAQTCAVRLEMEATATRLLQGQTATGTVTIFGTNEPVRIAVQNLSIGTVSLSCGDEAYAMTSGGNRNKFAFSVRALREGPYEVSGNVAECYAAMR